jgi:glucose/arabinose dehydrogenase
VAALATTALALALVTGCTDRAERSDSGDPTGTLPGGGAGATAADGSGTTGDPGSTGGSTGNGAGTTGAEPSGWMAEPLDLVPVASVAEPTALAARPGSDDLWLLEREGRVRLIEHAVDPDTGTGELRLLAEPVLDLSDQVTTDGEGGLLGLAFSAAGDQLYLDYTDTAGDTVVSSFALDGDTADPADEQVMLTVGQPYSNHNGGDLQLGPDGYLYIALGDGGSADDPDGNGQDLSTLLGALLRIDPTPGGEAHYLVPPDNPFVDDPEAQPEIWLYGVRNPWRFTFDPGTGDLWIGDVGQNEVEEIDLLPAADGAGRGANLGWNLMEGDQPFAGDPPVDHVAPIHVYPHEAGACSVTGGHVYRGDAIPSLDGVYLFSDYCSGGVAGIERAGDGQPVVAPLQLATGPANVVAFGQGPDGEVYVLEQGGSVSRIQPAGDG